VAFAGAEAAQASSGATNARFGKIYEEAGDLTATASGVKSCLIVTDDASWGAFLSDALAARGVSCSGVGAWRGGHGGHAEIATGFDGAARQVGEAGRRTPLDAMVVALAASRRAGSPGTGGEWQRILDEHAGAAEAIHADAGWVRAASDYSSAANRPLRIVTVTDASFSAGRTRAQAAAQLSRGCVATQGRIAAFAIAMEAEETSERRSVAELVAHLLCVDDATALAGAELAVGSGWLGLRSHPRPRGSISFGGPEVPSWLDGALRRMVTG
jgi:hypothetical protein